MPTTPPCPRRPPPLLATALALTFLVLLLGLGPTPAWAAPGDPVPGPVGPDPVGVWPLQPEPDVEHAFDPPDGPYGAGHRGVDLAGRPGQPVRTALPGTVTFAGSIAGRGVVVVLHGATRTTYEPVTASVGRGDVVAAGAVVGVLTVSSSHCFPAACLHWGWIAGDTYLDPLRLVGGGPVRLLPPGGAAPSAPGLTLVRASSPYAAWVPPLSAQARGWAWR